MSLSPTQKHTIDTLIASHPIVLFMKGSREQPLCGFSAQVVSLLNKHEATYHTVDILQDEDLRAAMKDYSIWPTFPQLYVQQTFIGGCDIVMDLDRKGTLKTTLQPSA